MVFYNHALGQTPSNDNNWDVYFSDDFNSRPSSPNWSYFTDIHNAEPQIYTNRTDNVFVNGGYLYLRALKEDYVFNGTTYHYTSGWIQTANTTYGYFEARCKCPPGRGFWPAFWTHDGSSSNCTYKELDVFENQGQDSHYTGEGFLQQHTSNCNTGGLDQPSLSHQIFNLAESVFDWHVWGCEWNSDKVIYYLDNREIWRYEIPSNSTLHQPMHLILNLAINPLSNTNTWELPPSSNTSITPFPGDLVVDYVKIYKLKTNSNTCTENVTVYDFTTYTADVKNNIIVGNGSTAVSVPSSSSVILRASNEITITNNFTVPAGSEFGAFITPCY